jgi:hypothetical protein
MPHITSLQTGVADIPADREYTQHIFNEETTGYPVFKNTVFTFRAIMQFNTFQIGR